MNDRWEFLCPLFTKPYWRWLGLCLLFGPLRLGAQIEHPFIQQIPAQVYQQASPNLSPQIWQYHQDRRGILFAANTTGVLSYDNRQWRLVAGTEGRRFQFVQAPEGPLYLSHEQGIGKLVPDSLGQLRFQSLTPRLPDSVQQALSLFLTQATRHGVYFLSDRFVIRHRPGQPAFDIFPSPDTILDAFVSPDQAHLFLVCQRGLYRIDEEQGKWVSRENFSVLGEQIRSSLPLKNFDADNPGFLLCLKEGGLATFAEGQLTYAPMPVMEQYPALTIWRGLRLDDSLICLATHTQGLLIIDEAGTLMQEVPPGQGLPTGPVYALFQDRERGLWASSETGISRVSYPVDLKVFGTPHGLGGLVTSLATYQGQLYASTLRGLFRASLLDLTTGQARFNLVAPEQLQEIWDLKPLGDDLLIAASSGTYLYDGNRLRALSSELSMALEPSAYDPDRVYVGLYEGLAWLERTGGRWRWGGQVPGFTQRVQHLAEAGPGQVWASYKTLSLVDFRPDTPVVTLLDHQQGVSSELGTIEAQPWNGQPVFGTRKGVWQYDSSQQQLLPHPAFQALSSSPASQEMYRLRFAEDGSLWYYQGKRIKKARLDLEGHFQPMVLPLAQFATDAWSLFPQADGPLWIGASNRLYAYQPPVQPGPTVPFQALIRRVSLQNDSLVFAGTYADSSGSLLNHQPVSWWQTYRHGQSDITFAYAATSFNHISPLEFSHQLLGYDQSWSPWEQTVEREKYTSLREGTYTFQVQARDPFGRISQPASFTFIILPPWYRTWWAYLMYAALLSLLVAGLVQLRTRVHRRSLAAKERELALERSTSERLRHIDQLKDQFLANTSHELRTPLNGIIGLAESMQDQSQDAQQEDQFAMIIASGRRLSSLVNDILDFSKLRHQEIELRLKPVDLHSLVQVVLQINQPLVGEKTLLLENRVPEDLPPALADEDRLQQILFNLIGNAIKFTDRGLVTVGAAVQKQGELQLWVQDTGIGIPAEQQARIFEAFEQGDGSISRSYVGTGLGLSISQKLVELHQGRLWLESEPGEGSTFTLSLPLGSEAALPPSGPSLARERSVPLSPSQVQETLLPASLPAAKAANAPYDQTPHLLIVDDEPINHQVLANHLKPLGYQLTVAMNGAEALAAIERGTRFDLVLLDVMMPRMSGYEVCEKIRERYLPSELPIIMVTAKNQVADLVEGLNLGANDYLAKPFSRQEFLARLGTHLDLHRIQQVTNRFVPTAFLRALDKKSLTDVRLGDFRLQTLSVLFSDIRNYTGLAEQMSPEDTFRFVSAYTGRMGPIIQAHQGFVNQYLGDGIMALFPHNSRDAIQAGIDMQQKLYAYNQARQAAGRAPLRVGIGLHTGPLIMGIIGDADRSEPAIISDVVNTAARLEGLTKQFGASLLISEETRASLGDPAAFHLRYLGQVSVKGRQRPVGVYECIDADPPALLQAKLATQDAFDAAMAAYLQADYGHAADQLTSIVQAHPADEVAAHFLDLAQLASR